MNMNKHLEYLLTFVPRPLPTGMTAHKAWADRIIRQVGPLADEESLRWALASQIMHLKQGVYYVPDQFFIRALKRAAANQISSGVFTEIKEAQEARKLKLQQEQTEAANQKATSDETADQKSV